MLELVAEVRIGDRDPIPLPVPSLLPHLRAWRMGKMGMWGWWSWASGQGVVQEVASFSCHGGCHCSLWTNSFLFVIRML